MRIEFQCLQFGTLAVLVVLVSLPSPPLNAQQAKSQSQTELLQAAYSAAQDITPPLAKASMLAQVGLAQAKANDSAAAETTLAAIVPLVADTFKDAEHPQIETRVSLIGNVARLQSAIKRSQAARQTLDKMIMLSRSIPDPAQKSAGLLSVAETQFDIGLQEPARQTLADAASAAGQIEQDSKRGRLLNAIAVAQARTGNIKAAVETAEKTSSEGYVSWSMPAIVDAIAREGDAERATNLLDEYLLSAYELSALFRAQTLTEVAAVEKRIGRIEAARITLKEAIAAAAGERNPNYRASLLSRIAVVEHNLGDQHAARSTLQAALTMSREIDDPRDRAFRFIEIAGAYAEVGDKAAVSQVFQAATAAVTKIPAQHRGYMSGQIAEALAKAGHADAALEVLKDDEITGMPRVAALIAISEAKKDAP